MELSMSSFLVQLETATNVILGAPNVVSQVDRAAAENIILSFRKTRNAFPLCKYILENSKTELVLFETADVLRNNLMQDWNLLPEEDIKILCQQIFNLLIVNTNFSYSIKRRLAGVIGLIVKHQSVASEGKERTELVNHIVGTALNTTGHQLVVACCVLDALLTEHQYVVNAEDASLTYEIHFASKKNFENSDLLRIFQFCLQFLTNYQHTPNRHKDLDNVLRLLENTLGWNFTKYNLPKRVAGVIESELTQIFKPPVSWLDTVNDNSFIPIFFNIHVMVRHDENFVLRTVNLVGQLVSMHRPLPLNRENKIEFLSKMLPPFTTLLSLPDKLGTEIYGLSDLIRKILLFNRTAFISGIAANVTSDFFKAIGSFSCQVIQQAAIEESRSNIDDRLFRESLTRLLEAWMNILTETENINKDIIQPIVTDIFNCYLKAHISPPEGFRQPISSALDDNENEEEADSTQFRDQLQAIGVFGRFILPHSIPIITQLFAFKCEALQKQIESVAKQSSPQESLDPIYEDLHWAILIAGHTIAFDGLGETNLIPGEINDYSIAVQANPDISANAFENAFQMSCTDGNNVDPIVRLISSVIMLNELERRINSSGLGHLLSPELASNILWFLHRFCESYFVLNEEYYSSISSCFLAAWGPSTSVAKMAQSSLLERIKENLMRYSGEVTVMKDAINLLLSLVDSTKKAELAIHSSQLPAIIEIANTIGPGKYQMPDETYRKLIRALVSIGSFCDDESKRDQYWNQILVPLSTRFSNLSTLVTTQKHRDDVRMEVSCVLSGFIGAAMSSHSKTATPLYKRIGPVVSQCGAILDMYHNYTDIVELCLELVIELAKRSLSYLSFVDSVNLYQAAMSVVKAYASHNQGRIHKDSKAAEEDTYNDLVVLMDMLTCLLSKDFLDLSPDAMSGNLTNVPAVTACDVSLIGLGTILPLMNADLLQFPSLSSKYFRLLAFLSELHPDKMMALPNHMLDPICHSAKIGLEAGSIETFNSCCEFISCIANNIAKNSHQNLQVSEQHCKPFLKIFLEMILSQKLGKECMSSISTVVFALISAFPDTYSELVTQLLCSRTTQDKQNKLNEAFVKLTVNLNLQNGGDRVSKCSFRERLETFIFEAKGCMD